MLSGSSGSVGTKTPRPRIDEDGKTQAKTWIRLVIRAIEEDLARDAPKCGNKYCVKFQPTNPKSHGWAQRKLGDSKQWLCETCTLAYDRKQFCQFCYQIYLENTDNFTTLDGQSWAACEEDCSRWAHVKCLAEKFDLTEAEVASDKFHYVCCGCRPKNGKKRANAEGYLLFYICRYGRTVKTFPKIGLKKMMKGPKRGSAAERIVFKWTCPSVLCCKTRKLDEFKQKYVSSVFIVKYNYVYTPFTLYP